MIQPTVETSVPTIPTMIEPKAVNVPTFSESIIDKAVSGQEFEWSPRACTTSTSSTTMTMYPTFNIHENPVADVNRFSFGARQDQLNFQYRPKMETPNPTSFDTNRVRFPLSVDVSQQEKSYPILSNSNS
jgi:hypothetical protein